MHLFWKDLKQNGVLIQTIFLLPASRDRNPVPPVATRRPSGDGTAPRLVDGTMPPRLQVVEEGQWK